MSDLLANDVRRHFEKAFQTITGIIDAFPEDAWLKPHGDDYYLPSRIAYHIAVVIDRYLAKGYLNPDFAPPYGNFMEATAQSLPGKADLILYMNKTMDKARGILSALDDAILRSAPDQTASALGETWVGVYLYIIKELAAHIGELNKMLIENGLPDIWIAR